MGDFTSFNNKVYPEEFFRPSTTATMRHQMQRKIKRVHHRSAIDRRDASTKLTLLSSMGVAVIGLLSGFLGNYVGQRTAAVSEADKIVREKLELSYSRTMSINDVALNLNMTAVSSEVTPPLANINEIGRYNDAAIRFQNAVADLVTPAELYGDNLEQAAENYVQCTKEFNIAATDTYFIYRQLRLKGDYGSAAYDEASKKVNYPVRLNALAQKREECQKLNIEFRKNIKQEIRRHTQKTIF